MPLNQRHSQPLCCLITAFPNLICARVIGANRAWLLISRPLEVRPLQVAPISDKSRPCGCHDYLLYKEDRAMVIHAIKGAETHYQHCAIPCRYKVLTLFKVALHCLTRRTSTIAMWGIPQICLTYLLERSGSLLAHLVQ